MTTTTTTTTTTTSSIVTIISPRLVEPVYTGGRLTQTTRDMDTEEVQMILANNLIKSNHL